MKVMNGLVMSLEENKIFLCVWLFYYVSNFADSRMEVPRYRSSPSSWDHFFFVSMYSAAVKCWAKLLPFRVNCRLQLAGLGKKREETVKPICFSLLYVESDFGTTQSNHRQVIRSILHPLIVDWKSLPVELYNSTIGVTCAVEAKEKLAIILLCEFWFPCSYAIWYDLRCHVAWRLKFR